MSRAEMETEMLRQQTELLRLQRELQLAVSKNEELQVEVARLKESEEALQALVNPVTTGGGATGGSI